MRTPVTDDAIGLAVAEQQSLTANIGTQLIGAVVCDPARAVPVAVAAGVTTALFTDHRDLLTLWTVADFDRHLDRDRRHEAIPHARFLLKHEHCWDASVRWFTVGSLWSDERLGWLWDSAFFCPPQINKLARDLAEHHRRLHQAAEHFRYRWELLTGRDVGTAPAIPQHGRPLQIHVTRTTRLRRRGAA